MSATAADGMSADTVLAVRVGNPEGRSVFPEFVAAVFGGRVVAAGKPARRASNTKPPRRMPRCPFVVYGPVAGAREVEAAARAIRRGWSPVMIACRLFSLPASHREAWRVLVMDFREPTYEPATLRRLVDDPRERAALLGWLAEGAAHVARYGMPAPTAAVLRATAEAVS